MAGKRPSDNTKVSSDNPVVEGDALFVTNAKEDRNLPFEELQRILKEGTGRETNEDKPNKTFTTRGEHETLVKPPSGTYEIAGGKIEFKNTDDSQWYEIEPAKTNGTTLKWKKRKGQDDSAEPRELFAVSVDKDGLLAYPEQFIEKNNILTKKDNAILLTAPNGDVVKLTVNVKGDVAAISLEIVQRAKK